MIYNIKAIPTVYNHVQFRSRLEARWAAFFDLAGIKWDYEPFDLEGWAPDFLLKTGRDDILVEVKPVDFDEPNDAFSKVYPHKNDHIILLLGVRPYCEDLIGPIIVARSEMRLDQKAVYVDDNEALWREAGNVVQWSPSGRERHAPVEKKEAFHLIWTPEQLEIGRRIRAAAEAKKNARSAA